MLAPSVLLDKAWGSIPQQADVSSAHKLLPDKPFLLLQHSRGLLNPPWPPGSPSEAS